MTQRNGFRPGALEVRAREERIALYELLFNNAAVPIGMAINEAVELAKTYGSEASSRFVNGVLGTVSRQCLPEPPTRETETEREPETEESRGPV